MKIIFTSFIFFLLVPSWALGKSTACFKVEGMTCPTCSLTIKTAVKKLNGIGEISISEENKLAKIIFDESQTNKDQIKEKIDLAGYHATEQQCTYK